MTTVVSIEVFWTFITVAALWGFMLGVLFMIMIKGNSDK